MTTAERDLIRQASQRLLIGTAQRSDGKSALATLAVETGIGRRRPYEHHGDLITKFRNNITGVAINLDVQGIRQQLADAHEQIRQ